MSEREEESFKAVQLDQHAVESTKQEPEGPPPYSSGTDHASSAQASETGESAATPASAPSDQAGKWASTVEQFKLKRFFVLRVLINTFFLFNQSLTMCSLKQEGS